MSDVIALVLFIVFLHAVLLIYWKGMGSARKKKFERLYGKGDQDPNSITK